MAAKTEGLLMRHGRKITFLSAKLPSDEGVRAMAQELRETAEDADPSQDPLHFVVGQDRSGHWIVTETHGLYGGIFCSKDAALRFAKFETADGRGDCAVTSDRVEFAPRRRRA
jgi:hypothetical protein